MTTIPSPAEVFGLRPPAPLIGFAGQKRSGKDTAAAALTSRGWRRLAFADQLRNAIRALDPYVVSERGYPKLLSELFRDGWGWETLKSSPYADEVRRILERGGTEMGREVLGGDVWVNALDNARRRLGNVPVVITDVRFANEADWIHSQGGIVVQIIRQATYNPNPTHASDTIDFACDTILANDGTVDELHAAVLKLADDISHLEPASA